MKKTYRKSFNKIHNLINRPLTKRIVGILLILLILQTIIVVRSYQVSYEYLKENDPRKMQNRSELAVYFAPFKIKQGMEIKQEEILAYLNELAYSENENAISGTYSIIDNGIKINSRLAEFPNVEITFNKNHLDQIYVDNKLVAETELEPLSMQNFIQFIGEEKSKELRIRQIVISPGTVPEMIEDAVTSAEDHRFREHFGLDWLAICKRAATSYLKDGGSGITQQLIKKNVIQGAKEEFWQTYLGSLDKKMQRKIMEIPFSVAANDLMSKDEILAAYLTIVPLGASNGIENHGFIPASKEYFGKTMDKLSLAETATIAGMINRPSSYLKYVRNGNYCSEAEIKSKICADLLVRRNAVLGSMLRNLPDKYPVDMIEKAKAEPLQFVFTSNLKIERPADYYSRLFAEYAAQKLPEDLEKMRNGEVNFRVFTTLDAQLQKQAMDIAIKNLAKLQPKLESTCRKQNKEKIDCSKVKLQIGIVAIEPQNGEILTMVGGKDTHFNYAVKANRSPASLVKPFYYLTAIEKGFYNGQPFTAATILNPEKDILDSEYMPTGNIGRKATVRTFLSKSWNFGAVAAANSVGIAKSTELYARLTNTTPEKTAMSAIGGTAGSETNLLNLTQAYTIFPNLGNFVEVTPFRSISRDGETVSLQTKPPKRMATAAGTFILNDMMSSVVKPGGTAPNFRQQARLSKDVVFAGKTGSGMTSDMWFIGFTPNLIIGVWIGVPNNEVKLDLQNGWSGGDIAATVAAEYLRSVEKYRPELLEGEFIQPESIVKLPFDNNGQCIKEKGSLYEFYIIERKLKYCQNFRSE